MTLGAVTLQPLPKQESETDLRNEGRSRPGVSAGFVGQCLLSWASVKALPSQGGDSTGQVKCKTVQRLGQQSDTETQRYRDESPTQTSNAVGTLSMQES